MSNFNDRAFDWCNDIIEVRATIMLKLVLN